MKYLSALLIPLITLLTGLPIIFDLARFRFSQKKVLIIFSIESLVLLIFNGTLLIVAGLDEYAKWYLVGIILPLLVVFIYTSERQDARDLFTILITLFFSFLISIPAMWISRLFSSTYLLYNLIRLALFSILFFLIHKFFREQYLLIQDEVVKGWGIFSILPVIGSGILYFEFLRYSKNGNFVEILYVTSTMIVFLSIVFGLMLYMFKQLHEKYIIQEQQRMLSMQNKAQLEHFLLSQEASEKSNRRWHDLRHNTQSVLELLESGDIKRATEYLKEHMNMPSISKVVYCEHFAVNSIMCLWVQRCKKEGISMEIMLNVPQELEIEPMELSALFSNAIENAYNSCVLIPQEESRYIKVESQYNAKRLAIGITNTLKGSVQFKDGIPLSLKSGGGIGTRSMIYTVKRFHGAYTFTAQDGLFITRFVLNV